MITITSQSALHQYDESGNAITTWDEKKCAWIVNSKYEKEEIDWYGRDSDFPSGQTEAEFVRDHPNWDKIPDIMVVWTWNSPEALINTFPDGSDREWCRSRVFPYKIVRQWGYIDYSEKEAVDRLGTYCKWNEHADVTLVSYNNIEIHNGKL